MNKALRQKTKNNFEKTMENVRKHRDIILATTKREETIQYQNQIIILKPFLQKIYQLQK